MLVGITAGNAGTKIEVEPARKRIALRVWGRLGCVHVEHKEVMCVDVLARRGAALVSVQNSSADAQSFPSRRKERKTKKR